MALKAQQSPFVLCTPKYAWLETMNTFPEKLTKKCLKESEKKNLGLVILSTFAPKRNGIYSRPRPNLNLCFVEIRSAVFVLSSWQTNQPMDTAESITSSAAVETPSIQKCAAQGLLVERHMLSSGSLWEFMNVFA